MQNCLNWWVSPDSTNNVASNLSNLFHSVDLLLSGGNVRLSFQEPVCLCNALLCLVAVLRPLSVSILFLPTSLPDTTGECVKQPHPSSEKWRLCSPAPPSFHPEISYNNWCGGALCNSCLEADCCYMHCSSFIANMLHRKWVVHISAHPRWYPGHELEAASSSWVACLVSAAVLHQLGCLLPLLHQISFRMLQEFISSRKYIFVMPRGWCGNLLGKYLLPIGELCWNHVDLLLSWRV